MRLRHTSQPTSALAPVTPPAAMLQAWGGAMCVRLSSQAHFTGCTIISSIASAPAVRLAPAHENRKRVGCA
jgi:hypothetical protein